MNYFVRQKHISSLKESSWSSIEKIKKSDKVRNRNLLRSQNSFFNHQLSRHFIFIYLIKFPDHRLRNNETNKVSTPSWKKDVRRILLFCLGVLSLNKCTSSFCRCSVWPHPWLLDIKVWTYLMVIYPAVNLFGHT